MPRCTCITVSLNSVWLKRDMSGADTLVTSQLRAVFQVTHT
jgi:hypothetical protein